MTAAPCPLLLFAGGIFFVISFLLLLVMASLRRAGRAAERKHKVDEDAEELGNDPQKSGDGHSPISHVWRVRFLAWEMLASRSAVLIMLLIMLLVLSLWLASDSIQVMRELSRFHEVSFQRAAELTHKAVLERLTQLPGTTLFLSILNRFAPFVLGLYLAQCLERSLARRADAVGRVLDYLRDAFWTIPMLLQHAA